MKSFILSFGIGYTIIQNMVRQTQKEKRVFLDKQIISEIKEKLQPEIRNHIRQIILFGSRVRGEDTPDSDLDILILVDQTNPTFEKELEESAYQVMWDHNFRPILSLKIYTEDHFQKGLSKGYSFYRNIQKEGIPA